jgi:hypothetical protein
MDKGLSGRRDRLVKEREHDVYRSRTKLRDPTLCMECGAVYRKGRWVWKTPPPDAIRSICPACRRAADRFPAGWIELQCGFFDEHQAEILNLVENVEKKEKAGHPMERIMAVERQPGGALVTTTGIHIARGIGAALVSAFHGHLNVCYLKDETCVRLRWSR